MVIGLPNPLFRVARQKAVRRRHGPTSHSSLLLEEVNSLYPRFPRKNSIRRGGNPRAQRGWHPAIAAGRHLLQLLNRQKKLWKSIPLLAETPPFFSA